MIARLLISPFADQRIGEIESILKKLQIPKNHPDLLYFEVGNKLGIEQAKAIKQHFSLKPYSAKGRAVVLEDASTLTTEAQNALLKTLEEPPEEAILLLGANSDADLLPTVLSRVEIVILGAKHLRGSTTKWGRVSSGDPGEVSDIPQARHLGGGVENDKSREDLEKLLKSSLEERFTYTEKLKEKEQFLHYMVYYFRQQFLDTPNYSDQLKFFIRELLEAEKWTAQNVNIRAILEYLMMIMPSTSDVE